MKIEEFTTLKHFNVHKGNVLVPATNDTREWLELQKHGMPVNLKLIEARDIKFHRCYFLLLSFVYDRLGRKFKETVPKDKFYNFLKFLSNEYDVVYSFKDGRQFIEYRSISFGRMTQAKFREYVNNQLSVIYEELLIPMELDHVMDEITKEFEKFLDHLI